MLTACQKARCGPLFVVSILALWLGGCATPVRVEEEPVLNIALLNTAASLEAVGDYRGAADVLMQAARTAKGSVRQDYQLTAAETLYRGHFDATAATILAGLDKASFTPGQRLRAALLGARIALDQNDPQKCLAELSGISELAVSSVEYHELRAEAYALSGDPLASARERVWLDPLLQDPGKRRTNQQEIWKTLSDLPDTALQQARTSAPPDTFGGWLELVELTRGHLQQPQVLTGIIEEWRLRYPDHPAADDLVPRLLGRRLMPGQRPQQVALLLPLSGPLAGAAAAVRDGLLAAYYTDTASESRPVIRFYDTAGDPELVPGLYRQAATDGAKLVIGPLRKESVARLIAGETLTVPVLALNEVDSEDDKYPLQLFQFGLAPEDEGREVARQASREGLGKAIAIIPDGSWGDRVLSAFREEWQTLGGELMEVQRYSPTDTDFSDPIRNVFNLDDSKQRQQALIRQLGRKLEFEPRRRQDVDFVFLLALPQQARLLRPQLRFYHAAEVPVYTTSHVYTGAQNPALDADMDDILFCDIPLILDPAAVPAPLSAALHEYWAGNAQGYLRLYALGSDAYGVMPYLAEMARDVGGYVNGLTGRLSMDPQRRLHRHLLWAEFRNGVPVTLATMPAESPAAERVQPSHAEQAGAHTDLP
jgi:outer membrane PBP1 activator LpoA protein